MKFKILGLSGSEIIPENYQSLGEIFIKEFKKKNPNTCYSETTKHLGYYDSQGVARVPYTRVLIQRIK